MGEPSQYSTRLQRWFSYQRSNLFSIIEYGKVEVFDSIPMTPIFKLVSQIATGKYSIGQALTSHGKFLFFKGVGYNWITLTEKPAYSTNEEGFDISLESVSSISIKAPDAQNAVLLACGKLGFLTWITYGDDFHVTKNNIKSIALPSAMSDNDKKNIQNIYGMFNEGLAQAYQTKLNAGKTIGSYNIASLWLITDMSDFIFAKYIAPSWSDEDIYKINTEVVKTAISIYKE